ncbi:MAG TPA: Fic family protein [Armatimonadota bacterium]
MLTLLGEADRALGGVASIAGFVPNPRLLVLPFLKIEAALSSRIEGTQTTPTQVFEAAVTPLDDLSAETREVLNYLEAMELGLESLRTGPLNMGLVRALHDQLLTEVRGADRTPGAYRTNQVFIAPRRQPITEASYIPPPALMVPSLMEDLARFLQPHGEIPPLVQCALVHVQFEMIHPFFDGNGRLGRLILSLMLIAWQYLPQPLLFLSAFLEKNRAEYYHLLAGVSERGDWEAWVAFFLRAVTAQSRQAITAARSILGLRDELRSRLQRDGATSNALRMVDFLFENPYTTIPGVASQLQVSVPTASKTMRDLEKRGFVAEITGRARRQKFCATVILDAILKAAGTEDEAPPVQPRLGL